jgi:hypothetical protein
LVPVARLISKQPKVRVEKGNLPTVGRQETKHIKVPGGMSCPGNEVLFLDQKSVVETRVEHGGKPRGARGKVGQTGFGKTHPNDDLVVFDRHFGTPGNLESPGVFEEREFSEDGWHGRRVGGGATSNVKQDVRVPFHFRFDGPHHKFPPPQTFPETGLIKFRFGRGKPNAPVPVVGNPLAGTPGHLQESR